MSEKMEKFKQKTGRFFEKSWSVIKHPIFLKNLGFLVLFLIVFLFITSKWISCYTNHGQTLVVPDLVDKNFEVASALANDQSFELIVSDSIFVLNQEPQLILNQNPLPKALVKEGRKIYVTISKVLPDLVTLPNLTGGNDDFNQYSRKLERLGITAQIIERQYSIKLERNTILEVKFDGTDITKAVNEGYKVPMGSLVEFVVSDRRGGSVEIPNLVCKSYEEASFLISSNKLKLGSVTLDNTVTDRPSAYVKRQVPSYIPSQSLDVGRSIDLVLTQSLPANCGGDDYLDRDSKKKDQQ